MIWDRPLEGVRPKRQIPKTIAAARRGIIRTKFARRCEKAHHDGGLMRRIRGSASRADQLLRALPLSVAGLLAAVAAAALIRNFVRAADDFTLLRLLAGVDLNPARLRERGLRNSQRENAVVEVG